MNHLAFFSEKKKKENIYCRMISAAVVISVTSIFFFWISIVFLNRFFKWPSPVGLASSEYEVYLLDNFKVICYLYSLVENLSIMLLGIFLV